MLKLQSKNSNYGINIPTEEKEINDKALNSLLSNVVLPKYYCVIALRYKTKLFDLAITSKSNTSKKQLVSVVPILAKFNEGEISIGKVGDRVLIDPVDIERGSHLNVNTVITPLKISDYINSDSDLTKDIISRKLGNDDYIYCLEFKIIPCNSIKGIIDGIIHDPFAIHYKGK